MSICCAERDERRVRVYRESTRPREKRRATIARARVIPGHTQTQTGYGVNKQQDTAREGAGHTPLKAGRSPAVSTREIVISGVEGGGGADRSGKEKHLGVCGDDAA